MTIHFIIPGDPVGKGRARVTKTGHAYTPQKTRDYEELVKLSCLAAHCPPFPKGVPIILTMIATYPIPKSASKKRRQMMIDGEILPTCKPDLSNVLKAVEDGLNNGIGYHDDSQIYMEFTAKKYGERSEVEVWIDERKNRVWSENQTGD